VKSESIKSRAYNFGSSTLILTFGNITDSNAEAVVSSDDTYLSMGGGVSYAILSAGGEEISIDAAKNVPAEVGNIVVTTAGRLPAKYVFHAITIGDTNLSPAAILHKTVSKCFDLLDLLGLQSIAFPAIGAGLAGFAYEDVAVEMANVIAPRLLGSSGAIETTIFLHDDFGKMQPDDFRRFFEEFGAKVPERAMRPTTLSAAPSTASLPSTVPQDGNLPKADQATQSKVSVFISYAHEDEKPYLEQLCDQLKALQGANLIDEWHDRDITAGADWRGEIDDHLNSAKLILLLISPAFINSEYCYDLELKKALERHDAGKATTIPIIVRGCIWSVLPFARLQVLPTDGIACNHKSWSDTEEAILAVAEGIHKLVESMTK
jgi:O-acetyl-ADP-ribose deacetylase (regulator of RNase III)